MNFEWDGVLYMKKSIQTNKGQVFRGTQGNMRIVVDFLPKPAELVRKQAVHKVTIALSDVSVNYFKTESKKLRTPYQRLIRNLLQEYVEQMGKFA